MPNRIVREGINSSPRVDLLAAPEEVFYRRLMSVVDDYGRFEGDPRLIRARCFPLRTDKITTEEIAKWASACFKAGLLTVYKYESRVYIELRDFKQQTRTASKFHSPSEGEVAHDDIKCYQLIANAHLVVSVSVSVVGGVSDLPPANGAGGGNLFENGKQPSGKPRQSPEKRQRSEAQKNTVIAIWMDTYEYVRRTEYKTLGRDKGAAKQLGELFPGDERGELRRIFRAHLRDSDFATTGWALWKVITRLQKYIDQVQKESARQRELQQENDDGSSIDPAESIKAVDAATARYQAQCQPVAQQSHRAGDA